MIQFHPFTDSDFDTLISWVDSEKTLLQFSGPVFKFPLTKEQLSQNISDPNRHAYAVTEAASGKMIAYAEIFITAENSAFLSRIIIGDPNKRGHGIGQQIMQLLLFNSFEVLGADNATLYVFDWNIPAIKCYGKTGFIINNDEPMKLEFNGEQWLVLKMSIERINKKD